VPIQYQRDDVRRRIVISFPGTFEPSDALAAIEQHHAEGVWTYGVLYDLRLLNGSLPNVAHLRTHMEMDVQRPGGESRPRGPVAILTADPTVYSLACTYAALGRSTMAIEVFRDWAEADAWLIANTKFSA
jgi:hypothetical protein